MHGASTMRNALHLALVALLAAAPTALAQDERPATCPDGEVDDGAGTCSRQAWVEDCPRDMMCAAGEDPEPYGDETCIGCSGPIDEGSSGTCMDGADSDASADASSPPQAEAATETCRDDVQSLDGRGPAGCENCRGEDTAPIGAPAQGDDATQKAVPAAGALLAVGALGAALLVRRR